MNYSRMYLITEDMYYKLTGVLNDNTLYKGQPQKQQICRGSYSKKSNNDITSYQQAVKNITTIPPMKNSYTEYEYKHQHP